MSEEHNNKIEEMSVQEEVFEEEIHEEEKQESEENLKSKIAALNEEIRVLNDNYLRANAEFENMKKRLEKEKFQAVGYAHEAFARDLLPIIDALENAIVSASSKEVQTQEVIDKYKEGIELTIEQFKKCFDKHHIKNIATDGEFDPNFHEAIMKVESEEVESGHIVQTLQKGYTIKDRVLRPSMVSIAK